MSGLFGQLIHVHTYFKKGWIGHEAFGGLIFSSVFDDTFRINTTET